MAAGKALNPRARKAAFSKKRKDVFREVKKIKSSAVVVIISPTGERYAYGPSFVEPVLDKSSRNDEVPADTDTGTDAAAAAARQKRAAHLVSYEKRAADLMSRVESVDVHRCKNDPSEMLKVKQQLMQLRGEVVSLICAFPSRS